MKRNIVFSLMWGMWILALGSCKKEKVAACDEEVTYESHVRAIIQQNCTVTGCHDGSNAMRKPLRTYDEVMAVIDWVERRAVIEKSMPPAASGGPLSEEEIRILRCWLEQGTPEK